MVLIVVTNAPRILFKFQIEIHSQLKNFIESNRLSDDYIDDDSADIGEFNENEEFEDNLDSETELNLEFKSDFE